MKRSALLYLAGALALSGCSSATTGGGGTTLTANATGSIAGNPLTTASVTKSGSTLSIKLDGTTYDLPVVLAQGTMDLDGRTYTNTAYRDGTGSTTPTLVAGESSLQYASLISLGKITGGTTDAFEVLATGTVETPAGNLPAQIVQYDGQYVLALQSAGSPIVPTGGTFTATADFTSGTVAFTTSDNLINALATINGSRFSGDINTDDAIATTTGKIAGGFYGPNAEEIAGVAGGTITCKSPGVCAVGTMDFSAGFLGGKTP